MKRIFSILMLIGLVFGMTGSAMAAGTKDLPDVSIGTSGETISETAMEIPAKTSSDLPLSLGESSKTREIKPMSDFVYDPPRLGSITVVKVDADDRLAFELLSAKINLGPSPLSGAVFGIYNEQGKKIVELTTGKDGTGTHTGLPNGDYFLKELKAPEGFVLANIIFPFSIETQGQNVKITVPNTKGYGTIKMIATDENNTPLSGVRFTVYRIANDKAVGELITLEDGVATLKLPLGRYYLTQTATKSGYKLLEERIPFALVDDGATLELPIQSKKEATPEGKIKLIKKSDSGQLLPGAVFGIYRADNNDKIGEITTDHYGEASAEFSAGDYYLRELEAPEGYKLDFGRLNFKIAVEKTTEIITTNKLLETAAPKPAADTGTLLLIKKAESTGKRLQGAVFGVYELSSSTLVTEITTGENGEATASLPAGDYFLLEHKAPSGYALEKVKITFAIKVETTVKVEITNMLYKDTLAPNISIPQTGEDFPTLNYTVAALMFGIVALCWIMLLRERKNRIHLA